MRPLNSSVSWNKKLNSSISISIALRSSTIKDIRNTIEICCRIIGRSSIRCWERENYKQCVRHMQNRQLPFTTGHRKKNVVTINRSKFRWSTKLQRSGGMSAQLWWFWWPSWCGFSWNDGFISIWDGFISVWCHNLLGELRPDYIMVKTAK